MMKKYRKDRAFTLAWLEVARKIACWRVLVRPGAEYDRSKISTHLGADRVGVGADSPQLLIDLH